MSGGDTVVRRTRIWIASTRKSVTADKIFELLCKYDSIKKDKEFLDSLERENQPIVPNDKRSCLYVNASSANKLAIEELYVEGIIWGSALL